MPIPPELLGVPPLDPSRETFSGACMEEWGDGDFFCFLPPPPPTNVFAIAGVTITYQYLARIISNLPPP